MGHAIGLVAGRHQNMTGDIAGNLKELDAENDRLMNPP
jgi:hypothetical protein